MKNVLSIASDAKTIKGSKLGFLTGILYLASGFIAHYNLQGFIDYYQDNNLMDDILNNKKFNQWINFDSADKDYNYYMSKKQVYNAICAGL